MRQRFLYFVLMHALILSSPSYGEETWKIASLNWEPYSSAEMVSQGNSIQKLRALLKQKNINLLVDFYPWRRAQKVALLKDYVGYFPAWPEEVHEGFVASPPIDWSWIGVLKKPNKKLDYQDLDDLFENYKVGLISTYTYPDEIMKAALKSPDNVIYATNELLLLKMLLGERQDCVITDPDVITYMSEKEGLGDIDTVEVLMKKELVIALKDDEKNPSRINLLKSLLQENNL